MNNIQEQIQEFIESEEEQLYLPEMSLELINDILLELNIEEIGKPEFGKYVSKEGDEYSLSLSQAYKEITITKEN